MVVFDEAPNLRGYLRPIPSHEETLADRPATSEVMSVSM